MKHCVIILDRCNVSEREAVHRIIKDNATDWWHQFMNTWVVSGRSLVEWRDLITPALESATPSAVLVLSIPDDETKPWTYYGPAPRERTEWFRENL